MNALSVDAGGGDGQHGRRMRVLSFPLFLMLACAGSAGGSSDPSTPATYPPKMVEGETVDADGKALDPKIRRCVEEFNAKDEAIGMAIAGEKSSVDTSEADFGTCWCKANGFRGQRMNGSCLP
ncbi:hypothetical protein [Nannocystis pusilla]|uniref:hypothetical protein n=1 Tax=Nannocystis pusilla TaxID=889268 RepID=UPI003DA37125